VNQAQFTAWLEGLSGEYQGRSISLSQGATLIGRSRQCQVQIHERRISRRHALIRFAQGRYFLQDQGSPLGTLLNGQPVQAVALNDGDIMALGQTSFRFRQGVVAQPIHPVSQPQYGQPHIASPPQQGGMPYAPPVGQSLQDAVAHGSFQALAQTQSYVGKAFLSWVMYYLGFFIIGLILNIMFLSEASRLKDMSGTSPSGLGCLQTLLIVHIILPIITIIMIFVLGAEVLSIFR
jgi:hypothetical protein